MRKNTMLIAIVMTAVTVIFSVCGCSPTDGANDATTTTQAGETTVQTQATASTTTTTTQAVTTTTATKKKTTTTAKPTTTTTTTTTATTTVTTTTIATTTSSSHTVASETVRTLSQEEKDQIYQRVAEELNQVYSRLPQTIENYREQVTTLTQQAENAYIQYQNNVEQLKATYESKGLSTSSPEYHKEVFALSEKYEEEAARLKAEKEKAEELLAKWEYEYARYTTNPEAFVQYEYERQVRIREMELAHGG